MRTNGLILLLALSFMVAVMGKAAPKRSAPERVSSYSKKNGTHVNAHARTAKNGTETDNWSTKGNTNPYTGKVGTRKPKK